MKSSIQIICRTVILLLLAANLAFPQSQKLKFERISLEQGLSQSEVFCILQDSKGFMWFGTKDGLNKYDGHNFQVYNYSSTDTNSLSNNWVLSLHEDKYGIFWIGTLNGLNRFDPKKEKFTRYKNDPSNPHSLGFDTVLSIFEDSSGTLWILTYDKQLNRFDREKEEFTRYFNDAESNSDDVYSIIEDREGLIWIATNGSGLVRYDRQKDQFTSFVHDPSNPNSLSSNIVYIIYESFLEPGVLWLGTVGGGLSRFDKEKERFINYKHNPTNPNSLCHNNVSSIHEDNTGALWIGTFGWGLSRLSWEDRAKGKFKNYTNDKFDPNSPNINYVASIFEDKSGMLWIITEINWEDGIYCFDKEKEKFTHYMHNSKDPNSLSHNRVRTIYEDNSGILWIGTMGGGITKLSRETHGFIHYKHDPSDPNSLSNNGVNAIVEDRKGTLWIGGAEGLNKYDRAKNEWTQYEHDPNDPNSLCDNNIFSIHESNEREKTILWIGTHMGLNKLVQSLDSVSQEFNAAEEFIWYEPTQGNPNGLLGNNIYTIIEDRSGALWIGANGALNRFDRAKNKWTHYQHDPINPNSLSSDIVRAIFEDSFGILWIGTDNGLNKLFSSPDSRGKKFDEEKFIRYSHDPDNPNSLSGNRITAIYADQSGILWVGTEFRGFNKFDRENDSFTQYTRKDGLVNNTIHGILGDASGNIWLSTNKGLSKFDPLTESFRNYDVSDGLQGNEFNRGAYYQSKSGEMFFGGDHGLNAFHPDSLRDNSYKPPIVITDFQISNESVKIGSDSPLQQHITETQEITLSYNNDVFSFEFAVLDYNAPQKNQYAYMMEGFDEDWIYSGNRRFVTYTNLDPGEYVFRVKGSNNDGIWNKKGTFVRIIITPPWWQTWWAYILYIVLIGLALYAARQFEMARVHLKNDLRLKDFESQHLHEVDQMKSRFFANISHEFRTPLTLILGPLEQFLADKFKGDPKEQYGLMHRNARKLLRLINQLLDLSKLEAGRMSLQARPQNIVTLLKGLVLSFASLAERKRIELTFNATEDSIIIYLDQDKLEKIVSNVLSNAFKFTPEGGRISVQLAVSSHQSTDKRLNTENCLLITVRDSGIGIPPDHLDKIFDRFYQTDDSHTPEQEGTGIGLALTKELVELHHGEIRVTSEPGKGSTFTVRLPLGKEHLKPEEIVEEVSSDRYSVFSDQFSVASDQQPTPSGQQSTTNDQHPATSDQHPLLIIVEDNADVRRYICSCLEQDYRIIEASDGQDGLEKAIDQMPDLVISDVMMPVMDGFEFCRKLKTDERTSHIPVILLTARASGESKIEGLETGADDYLTKPFDAKELRVRAKNLIEQRRKLWERFHREIIVRPKDITVTSMDEELLKRAMEIVEEHIADTEFSVEIFSRKIGMSRVHLNRKLKALTDHSSNEFVRSLRLKRAAQLLEAKSATVVEIAYEVGFNNPSWFAECFRKQFGKLPSEYANR